MCSADWSLEFEILWCVDSTTFIGFPRLGGFELSSPGAWLSGLSDRV